MQNSISGLFLLLATLLALSANPVFANGGGALNLEWQDLIPFDWEPPAIPPAPQEELDRPVDASSLNPSLQNKRVRLSGHIKPVKFTSMEIHELLLVPFLEQYAAGDTGHNANQKVYVILADPIEVQDPYALYRVTGRMTLTTVQTLEGPTGYRISNASVALHSR